MKRLVILFIVALLLGGGGAAAWFLYLEPSDEQPKATPIFVELDQLILPIIDDDQVIQQVTLRITLEMDAAEEERVLLVQRHLRDAFLTELHGLMALRVVRDMDHPRPFLERRLSAVGERLLGPGVLKRIMVTELIRRRTLGS